MKLERLIRAEIDRHGPMTFERFMELALYHPDFGYYASERVRTGWRGQFVTSPELDPVFGELWGRAFEQIWDGCDRPGTFDVVEIGPGTGAFAAAVLSSAVGDFRAALRYRLVEPSRHAAALQRSRLTDMADVVWHNSVNDVPTIEAGCWFANEVVDNIPIRLVEKRNGEIRELLVGAANGNLALDAAATPSDELARFFTERGWRVPEGHRAEVSLAAERLVSAAASRLKRGSVVLVDYGDEASGLMLRPSGSLLCYSGAGVDERPLENPGTKDITVHANWTGLRAALASAGLHVTGPLVQSTVLRRLGLGAVAEALRRVSRTAKGPDVLRALSQRGALASLTEPGGLGGFGVLVGMRGCAIPEFARSEAPSVGPDDDPARRPAARKAGPA
jgi:SAM-dependent MidA family methyltransferase